MRIFAISDLHLSFQSSKPMDLFGSHWENYEERIALDWNLRVGADDIVLVAGDISWAMKMEETRLDFEYISKLKGKKIIIRGNHDYWWKSISKIRETLPKNIIALQNDSIKIDDVTFAGTRGWRVPERRQVQDVEDKKIYEREIIRFNLALKDAREKAGPSGKIVTMLHYPPFNATRDDSPFTRMCEKYGVSACVYGHLHGNSVRAEQFVEKNGVAYYLTSCDLVNHKVVEIKL